MTTRYHEELFYLRDPNNGRDELRRFLRKASNTPRCIFVQRDAPAEGETDFCPYDGNGEPNWRNCPVGMGAIWTPIGGAS